MSETNQELTLKGFVLDVLQWSWNRQEQLSVNHALISSALFVTELVASWQNGRCQKCFEATVKGSDIDEGNFDRAEVLYFPFLGFIWVEKSLVFGEKYIFWVSIKKIDVILKN